MSDPAPRPPATAHDTLAGPGLLMGFVSAGLFLYVGFVLGLSGISEHPLYNHATAAFTWGARIVGIGLLITLGLELLRLPAAALLDLLLSTAATAGCLAVGVIWIYYGDSQGYLLLLFAAVNGSATHQAWQRWHAVRRGHTASEPWNS